MESSTRNLRSRPIVPATKSPQKAHKASGKAKAPQNVAKSSKKPKDAGGDNPKTTQTALAMQQAKEYLGEELEDEVGKARQGKRARNGDEDEEDEAAEMIAEAQMLVEEWAEMDEMMNKIKRLQEKASNSIQEYNEKAALAKQLPKGPFASAKQLEIKNKLSSIHKLLKVYPNLTKKRHDELFDVM